MDYLVHKKLIVFFVKAEKKTINKQQSVCQNYYNQYNHTMDIASILCGIGFMLFMGYLINKLNKDNQGY